MRPWWLAVVIALACACSGRGSWPRGEPDGRGQVAPPLCALQERGLLSERAQLEVLRGREQELRGCLGAAREEPVVVAAVGRDGFVQSVGGPGGGGLDGEAASCLAGVVRSLRFPAPSCERAALLSWRFRAAGPPVVLGGDGTCREGEGLTAEELRELVAEREGDVRRCFEERLERHPGLQGRVVASFVVGSTGRVVWVGLSEELSDQEVGRCVVGALRSWRFPAPCNGLLSMEERWEFEPPR